MYDEFVKTPNNPSLNKLSNELFYTENKIVNKKIQWFDQGCSLVLMLSFQIFVENLNQSDHMDWKIITIEGEEKVFFGREPWLFSMFWNSIEIRWIGLQFAKV
jgi:hypothetical protein